jgi:copper homeostasis protein
VAAGEKERPHGISEQLSGQGNIVFGILTADGRVDGDRCRRLLGHAGDRAAVFHRAFDITPDPFQAQEQLIDLGFRAS